MEIIFNVIIGIVLLGLATIDFYKKEVPVWMIVILGTVCIIGRILLGINLLFVSCGMSIGGCILALAILSKEKIGVGDGLVIICLGFFLGASKTVWLLFYASVIMTTVSFILIIFKKKNVKNTLPFIPAILLGFLIV